MAIVLSNGLEQEGIAKSVADFYVLHNARRLRWLEESADVRSYLAAGTTAGTAVSANGWKNNTTVPKLTQIFDNLKAYYMSALFPDDTWFVWEGSNALSQAKANAIEQYMSAKIRDSDFRSSVEQMIVDWIVYGMCFGGVSWKKEEGPDNVKKETPILFRISPLDVIIDPYASCFEDAYCILRRVVSMGKFMSMVKEDWDQTAVSNVLKVRNGIAKDDVDLIKEAGLQIEGWNSYDEYLTSGGVEILEYYGDVWDDKANKVLRNQQIFVADRMFVLYKRPSPSWSYKRPLVMGGWRRLPDDLYCYGPLHQIVGMQYRVDHLENAKADIFDLTIHPVTKIKGDTVEDFEWGPGVQIRCGSEGDVEIMPPDPQVLVADNEIAYYHKMMEEMAGAPREMMGLRSPGEKTAFEVGVLEQGASRMFLDKVAAFEEQVIQPILNMMLELAVRNMNIADTVRVLNGPDDAVQFVSITKEDLTAPGVLRPVGSRHYASRQKRVQELQGFLQVLMAEPFIPHVSFKNAGNMLEKELGFEKYGIFEPMIGLMEQAEIQSQVALLQEMSGVPGQPPEAGV